MSNTELELILNELAMVAATLCTASVAIIKPVGFEPGWFKSGDDIDVFALLRNPLFSDFMISQSSVLIIPDLLAGNHVTCGVALADTPYLRFYANIPLVDSNQQTIGALVIVDTVAHYLLDAHVKTLQVLGRQIVSQIKLHRRLTTPDPLQLNAQSDGALHRSEEQFRIMANSAPVLIWMDDENQQAIFQNLTWHQFTGRSPEHQLGDGWTLSLHPDDLERWRTEYDLAFATQKPYTMEYRLRRADGEYRWMLETGVPRFHPDGAFAGFTGSCVDITERKTSEQHNKFLREVTHAIVGSSNFHSALAIALEKVCEATQWEFGEAWVPNFENTMMECSPAWYGKCDRFRTFREKSQNYTFPKGVGIPGRVWVSRQVEWHQNISAESASVYPRVQLALETGLKATLGIPLLANDKVISVLVFYMTEARQEDQRLISLITASTELGLFIQRKQAEEEMQKLLEKEQELNQFKSNFIANISHELRTPLTSILGLSNVLIQQYYGELNSKQAKYLSLIHSSGEHLLNLINDLLDLAKIEAGKQELFKTAVNVTELCQSAIEMVEIKAIAKNLLLRLELPVAIDSIVVDPQRILQVLLNYLSNAVKFTPDGGSITIKSRLALGSECCENTLAVTAPTSLSIEPDAQFLVLEVTDTGIGISRKKQHLLFKDFQQIDAKEHQFKGSGLGLVLAKHWAELHDGRVSFSSTEGVGSTFAIWLPL